MCLEYLKRRGFDVCQNTNYSARNCQSESLNLTSLALPPGKRDTKRNLKTITNTRKTLWASEDKFQWVKEKRHNLIWGKRLHVSGREYIWTVEGQQHFTAATSKIWGNHTGEGSSRGQCWRHTPVWWFSWLRRTLEGLQPMKDPQRDEEQWVAWISRKKPAMHQPNLMGHLPPHSKGQGGIECTVQGSGDQKMWRRNCWTEDQYG